MLALKPKKAGLWVFDTAPPLSKGGYWLQAHESTLTAHGASYGIALWDILLLQS